MENEERMRWEMKKAGYQIYKDVPHDLQVEILLRLPAKSLARFRCVCKLWNSLTYDRSFVLENHRRRAAHKSMIFCDPYSTNGLPLKITRLDLAGKFTHEFTIPGFDEKFKLCTLSNSVDGLTCLYRCYAACLLNPTTREFVVLPTNKPNLEDLYILNVGFGFSTYTGEYKVVRQLFVPTKTESVWEILTLGGTNEWRSIKQVPPQAAICKRLSNPVFLNGALHWMVHYSTFRGVLVFDMYDETFRYISPLAPAPFVYLDVTELNGHIGLVTVSAETCLVEIWKLEDYTNGTWIKEYTMDLPSWEVRKFGYYLVSVVGFHNGNLFIDFHGSGLSSYDLLKKTTKVLRNGGLNTSSYLYTESLVSPKLLCGLKRTVKA